MFRLISKERYEFLKSEIERTNRPLEEKVEELEKENEWLKSCKEGLLTETGKLRSRCMELIREGSQVEKECKRYKSLYADELQKRIELAEAIRKMEEK